MVYAPVSCIYRYYDISCLDARPSGMEEDIGPLASNFSFPGPFPKRTWVDETYLPTLRRILVSFGESRSGLGQLNAG